MNHAHPVQIPRLVADNKTIFKNDLYQLAEVLTSLDIRQAVERRKAETEQRRDAIWNNDDAFKYEEGFE